MTSSTSPEGRSGEGPTAQTAVGLWAVGDPGRAALEVGDGHPTWASDQSDIAVSSAAIDGVVIRAASVRGLLHRRHDEPRQDAYALATRRASARPDAVVAAVCDGVGWAPRSHVASRGVAVSLVEAAAAGAGWDAAFAQANAVLSARIAAEPADADGRPTMATTAVALVLEREAGRWHGQVAWVGDSTCWHVDVDGRWTELTGAHGDEEQAFYSTAVAPLPSQDGRCRQVSLALDGGAVFLLTDGVANPLAWSVDVQDALADWWAAAPDPLTFAGQVGFARKGHMDDRTAVGLWLPPAGEADDEGAGDVGA
jgi:Protein phosphatase 2C